VVSNNFCFYKNIAVSRTSPQKSKAILIFEDLCAQ
jgi:hypothetical protein